ncbi:MAG: response regulator [Deltaproteobacteria bacterium]|nr:response regulator [Deltaproteobacteria bacterium]
MTSMTKTTSLPKGRRPRACRKVADPGLSGACPAIASMRRRTCPAIAESEGGWCGIGGEKPGYSIKNSLCFIRIIATVPFLIKPRLVVRHAFFQYKKGTLDTRKKILIVDDNRTTLKLLEKQLTDAGYRVIQANNGRDAVFLAGKEQPDLIISDVEMPRMDGGEVAKALKESPNTKHIPLFFFTGLVEPTDEYGSTTGKIIYISKQCKPEELLEEIRKYL